MRDTEQTSIDVAVPIEIPARSILPEIDIRTSLRVNLFVKLARGMAAMKHVFKVGDPVIFVMSKNSSAPGPRAKDVHPSAAGETYSYLIESFLTVSEVGFDGSLQLVSQCGEVYDVFPDDLRLRPARWWERWRYRDRFPNLRQVHRLLKAHA